MNLLVLDPAKSCGFCVCKIVCENDETEEKIGEILECGFIDIDTSSVYQGDHCICLMNILKSMIEKNNTTHIAVEDYFFSKKTATGSNVNAALRTAIYILARNLNINYTILNISSWKNHIAGRRTPTLIQKNLWKGMANKFFIQQALFDKYNIKFPNHSISQKGKYINHRSDIVDAVAQAIYYMEHFEKVKTIINKIIIPENIVYKKNTNKNFIYS